MGWAAKDQDGNVHHFNTHAEAEEFRLEAEAHDDRTPEQVWDAAERPRVSRETFLRRMRMGWTADRALNTLPDGRYLRPAIGSTHPARMAEALGGRDAQLHEVLGRKRTLQQWSDASGISVSRLDKGAKRHGSLEAYLLYLGWYPSRPASTTPDPE